MLSPLQYNTKDGEHGWYYNSQGWMYGLMDGWMDAWLDECMDGWMGHHQCS